MGWRAKQSVRIQLCYELIDSYHSESLDQGTSNVAGPRNADPLQVHEYEANNAFYAHKGLSSR